jgi:3-hydroxybutyryl-CoA dehydrogenase
MLARSGASAERARAAVGKVCGKLGEVADAGRISVVTDPAELGEATFLVEAVVEDHDSKVAVLETLHDVAGDEAVLATTTSSLSVHRLADELDIHERFVGLHVFNPVPRMKLVELAFPADATPAVRERARALCQALDKTPVEVPDTAGFVVNRLLFPYLFDAVQLLEESGMAPGDIDTCMTLGAGHPMGPLALLDYVGLDVSVAIGESIEAPIPQRLRDLVAEGALGRKSGRGLYDYAE